MSDAPVLNENDPEYLEWVLKRKQQQYKALGKQISHLQLRIHDLKRQREVRQDEQPR